MLSWGGGVFSLEAPEDVRFLSSGQVVTGAKKTPSQNHTGHHR
ncbi:DUF779 domain-containing protein [Mycobacterium lepromatosis]|nr:DUF779 domain-containing protein [Mycobacterium lepromatosis]